MKKLLIFSLELNQNNEQLDEVIVQSKLFKKSIESPRYRDNLLELLKLKEIRAEKEMF